AQAVPVLTPADGLRTIAMFASNDVWAAGKHTDNAGYDHPMAVHWDGASWTKPMMQPPDLLSAGAALFDKASFGLLLLVNGPGEDDIDRWPPIGNFNFALSVYHMPMGGSPMTAVSAVDTDEFYAVAGGLLLHWQLYGIPQWTTEQTCVGCNFSAVRIA